MGKLNRHKIFWSGFAVAVVVLIPVYASTLRWDNVETDANSYGLLVVLLEVLGSLFISAAVAGAALLLLLDLPRHLAAVVNRSRGKFGDLWKWFHT